MLLKWKLTPARFVSCCNVFDDNATMLDEKLPYESYHTLAITHCATFKEWKLTLARFSTWCILIDDNVVVLNEKLHYES